MSAEDESALIRRAVAGDDRAFEALVDRHAAPILQLATSRLRDSVAASEVVQDVFVRMFRSLRSFRGDASLRTWLVRVTMNRCNDVDRARRRQALHMPLEFAVDIPGGATDGVTSDDAHQLQQAIAALPVAHQEILMLRYDADLSYSEISTLLKIPMGTVGSRVASALKTLRTQLASTTATS